MCIAQAGFLHSRVSGNCCSPCHTEIGKPQGWHIAPMQQGIEYLHFTLAPFFVDMHDNHLSDTTYQQTRHCRRHLYGEDIACSKDNRPTMKGSDYMCQSNHPLSTPLPTHNEHLLLSTPWTNSHCVQLCFINGIMWQIKII